MYSNIYQQKRVQAFVKGECPCNDFYWIKGLALAGFMLLMGMGLVVDMMGIAPQMRQNAVGVLFHIISYIAYGLAVSYFIFRFSHNMKEQRQRH